MAAMNSQFTIDEDQEMETQHINLSSDASEIASSCSSPIPQLPNNVPDTFSAITQLIAAQREQMSSSSKFAPQYPTTRQLQWSPITIKMKCSPECLAIPLSSYSILRIANLTLSN